MAGVNLPLAVGKQPRVLARFKNIWSCLCNSRNLQTCSNLRARYVPRRSLMYVPGSDEKKISKIPSLGADCIVMDCEDGVAANRKDDARNLIHRVLNDEHPLNFGKSEQTVRINGVESGVCAEDIQAVLSAKKLPSAIHLPKVESVEHVEWFLSEAGPVLKNNPAELSEPIFLIMFVESAQALISLADTVKRSILTCSNGTFFKPDALVFGSDDYCASVGATRSKEAHEVMYARQYVVTVAKAFQLQAIDVVYIDYKDPEGLRKQSAQGAAMGYTGKQVIHPSQVSVCHEMFTPAKEKIAWARELIDEFAKHQEFGQGAFTFRGQMIDMPLLKQAQNIVDLDTSLNVP